MTLRTIRFAAALDRRRARRDRRGGFTLVELLVVLVILSLIMGLVGPRVLSYLSDARGKSARLQIEAIQSALDLFYLDMGRYPTTSEGLQALVVRVPNADRWNGPYLNQTSVPLDPWGNPYDYRSPGASGPYEITSLGSDGRKGGTGDASDITSTR
ncbi:general secretion pathway protein G [Tepidamorphus gemmatus]|uniref:Type II secretion system core protein G n=1 Tax=Tepidamorphus gemmatus TaxID=747076 RepID=A0A4R3M2Q2_9HYPH|nr:type II secretion system major pseudopilin GspG [Tepidamorphus gemmatus]TCT06499.1 general secretion pathway protein G [Tepidamorphus gemmatus]